MELRRADPYRCCVYILSNTQLLFRLWNLLLNLVGGNQLRQKIVERNTSHQVRGM